MPVKRAFFFGGILRAGTKTVFLIKRIEKKELVGYDCDNKSFGYQGGRTICWT